MDADVRAELDELKKQMEDLKAVLCATLNQTPGDGETPGPMKRVHPMHHMHPDPGLSRIMDRLCSLTEEKDLTGAVTYLGVFTSGGRQSNWIRNEIDTDDLLRLIEEKQASAVLQCIGSSDRLNLLAALLRQPMTVAEMVDKCRFNTTGQAYHHLRPLIAADIVGELDQPERGVYAVKFHRVQGIIMLLAGIADLVDPQYSQGEYVPDDSSPDDSSSKDSSPDDESAGN